VEYKTKEPAHIEWAKSLKELYLPGLKEYVKAFYPLGPVWGSAGSPTVSALSSGSSKQKSAAQSPPVPPPPSTCLFSSENAPSQCKTGMSAVFQEISSGKPVTAGNPLKHSLGNLRNVSSECLYG